MKQTQLATVVAAPRVQRAGRCVSRRTRAAFAGWRTLATPASPEALTRDRQHVRQTRGDSDHRLCSQAFNGPHAKDGWRHLADATLPVFVRAKTEHAAISCETHQ
jgi:hypothetical protein